MIEGLTPLAFLFLGGMLGVIMLLIGMVYLWVWPLKHCVADEFVQAYRKRKRVAIMDDGVRFNVFLCDRTADGFYRHVPSKNEEYHGRIDLTPRSERTMDGGIRAVVGNYENMKGVNTQIADIITTLVKRGVRFDQVKAALNQLEEELKRQTQAPDIMDENKDKEVKHEAEGKTEAKPARRAKPDGSK
jgi:hypothetical protein